MAEHDSPGIQRAENFSSGRGFQQQQRTRTYRPRGRGRIPTDDNYPNPQSTLNQLGVSDLRQHLVRKQQTQQAHGGPPSDRSYNYLKDPMREENAPFSKVSSNLQRSNSYTSKRGKGKPKSHGDTFIENPVNIKIELSRSTGERNVSVDEETTLPNIPHIPDYQDTVGSHRGRGSKSVRARGRTNFYNSSRENAKIRAKSSERRYEEGRNVNSGRQDRSKSVEGRRGGFRDFQDRSEASENDQAWVEPYGETRGRGQGEYRGNRGRGSLNYRGRGSADYVFRDPNNYRGRGTADYRSRETEDYRSRGIGDYRVRSAGEYRGPGEHRNRGDNYKGSFRESRTKQLNVKPPEEKNLRRKFDGEQRGRGRGRTRGGGSRRGRGNYNQQLGTDFHSEFNVVSGEDNWDDEESVDTSGDKNEFSADNLEPSADNLEPAADNLEPAADNLEPAAVNLESSTDNKEPFVDKNYVSEYNNFSFESEDLTYEEWEGNNESYSDEGQPENLQNSTGDFQYLSENLEQPPEDLPNVSALVISPKDNIVVTSLAEGNTKKRTVRFSLQEDEENEPDKNQQKHQDERA